MSGGCAKEDKAVLSRHDFMYWGMWSTKRRMFPVHRVLIPSPGNGLTLKNNFVLERRFPFDEGMEFFWNKHSKFRCTFFV